MTDSTPTGEPDDVAEEEAEAVAEEISAERIDPDNRLTAPTSDDPREPPKS